MCNFVLDVGMIFIFVDRFTPDKWKEILSNPLCADHYCVKLDGFVHIANH